MGLNLIIVSTEKKTIFRSIFLLYLIERSIGVYGKRLYR